MKRRKFLTLSGIAGLIAAGACALRPGKANPYYSGPVSDHFDGTRFFNPGGTPPRGFGDFLRWRFGTDAATWPDSVPITRSAPARHVDGLRVTMVGHATLLIQSGGLNILTDPVWSDRASPVSFVGPSRVTAPGIAFDDLPPVDVVLLSHNHYDHLDLDTLGRLHAAHGMPVLTPLGNDTILREATPGIDVRAADWNDIFDFTAMPVRLLPCHHWSARGTGDRSMALWGAFALETPAGRVLFVGDTGFDRGQPYRAAATHGPYRLAVLPIGAYAPRWFMKPQHQNPAEAVEGFALSTARHAVASHWGTFQLTDEPRDEPPAKLAEALAARNVSANRFAVLRPGEIWDVPP